MIWSIWEQILRKTTISDKDLVTIAIYDKIAICDQIFVRNCWSQIDQIMSPAPVVLMLCSLHPCLRWRIQGGDAPGAPLKSSKVSFS